MALKTRNEENHMRKLLEAEYANQQLDRARQRLQGHREGMADAIRTNAESLAQQKKEEAGVLREQSSRITAYVSMQREAHIDRAKKINHVSARRPACHARTPVHATFAFVPLRF